MKLSKTFHIIKEQDHYFIDLEEFYVHLKKENQGLRRSNLRRTLKSYGLKNSNGKELVPDFGVLRYCFQYCDTSSACKEIAEVATKCTWQDNSVLSTVSSTLELYKLISKTKFHESLELLEINTSQENEIETLICEHKQHFSVKEWGKICWFEKNFCKYCLSDFHDSDYEHLLTQKFRRFQSLLSFKECQEALQRIIPDHIKEKQLRIKTAELINTVDIFTSKKHKPFVIEIQLKNIYEQYTGETDVSVVCFDDPKSQQNNFIHIAVSLEKTQNFEIYNTFCERAVYFIRRRHDCDIKCIYFVLEHNLQSYFIEEEGCFARFQLRDDILLHNFKNFLYSWETEKNIDVEFVANEQFDYIDCGTCTQSTNIRPLSLQNFNVEEEWLFETPAELQIILESFLNKRGSKRSSD